MLHEVDNALRALIEADRLDGAETSFEAPTREWAASRQNAPTINVFLYDVREDMSRRDVAVQVARDVDGRVVERRPPARRFRLSYLLSAWTQRAEDEHLLLARLLQQFLRHDAIPREHLSGSLVDSPFPVLVQMALPPTEDRSLSDIWSALGGELKPSLDLMVIAPLDPHRTYKFGPPVTEQPRLEINGRRPQISPIEPLEDGGDRVQAGADEKPGRTLLVRRVRRSPTTRTH